MINGSSLAASGSSRAACLVASLRHVYPGSCRIAAVPCSWPTEEIAGAEAALVEHASEARKADFYAGRHAARAALTQLGVPAGTILTDAGGAPIWPNGTIGSIAHGGGVAVAVAALTSEMFALGIDLERTGAVTRELWMEMFRSEEIAFLASQPAVQVAELATAMFTAKEAFYKLQYPLTRQWVGFHDVSVRLFPSEGRWLLTTKYPVALAADVATEFAGRHEIGGDLTFAAAYCSA